MDVISYLYSEMEYNRAFGYAGAQTGQKVYIDTSGQTSYPVGVRYAKDRNTKLLGVVVRKDMERNLSEGTLTVSLSIQVDECMRGLNHSHVFKNELAKGVDISNWVPLFTENLDMTWGADTTKEYFAELNKRLGEEDLKPEKVIFNGITTICYFKDGTKEIARPSGDFPDKFDPEVGVAMCIMKKMYGSRKAFLKAVDGALYQNSVVK